MVGNGKRIFTGIKPKLMKLQLSLLTFVLTLMACSPETCTDGILNQNEIDIDCGGECVDCCLDGIQDHDETGIDCGGSCGSCAIEYPDNGYYGVNILNMSTTSFSGGNAASLHAILPEGTALKVILTNTSGSNWFYYPDTKVNLDVTDYNFTTNTQVFQAMYDDQLVEVKLIFNSSPGSAIVDIYENNASSPTRSKNITW